MPRLPDRAARGGGPQPPQCTRAAAHGRAASHCGLCGGPLRLRGGVRGGARGLHLRPRARPRRASCRRNGPRRKRAEPGPRSRGVGQGPTQAFPFRRTVTWAGISARAPPGNLSIVRASSILGGVSAQLIGLKGVGLV